MFYKGELCPHSCFLASSKGLCSSLAPNSPMRVEDTPILPLKGGCPSLSHRLAVPCLLHVLGSQGTKYFPATLLSLDSETFQL